jgi:CO/xanthine dehydrogenase Mo-binding subunit
MKALPWSHLRPQGQTYLPLQDDKIHYAGQPVAIVVAETLDQAARWSRSSTRPTNPSCSDRRW